ncbi:hypothetical protein KC366_g12929 [Hortaea werneckii]|nr:hypothetical protein KC366_g12929 [Hortaea werneckii]KAI7129990.1 hypothetical protein KC337_g7239 [Hortaea werneckii]
MPGSFGPSSSPTDDMREQPEENSEHGGHPSRSPVIREGDCDSTAIPRSLTSPQVPGEKKTAGDDILAVVPTNPSHVGSSHGDIESGPEHKEEPDNLSPRNASHAEGTVLETLPEDEVHYATMSWWHTALAETVSLGILSLPSALATLGYIPGILLILTLGLLSWYTGHIIYQLKMQHFTSIHSYADIFDILWPGGPGRWVGEVATNLVLVFIVAAHVVTFTCLSILLATFTALTSIALTTPHPPPTSYTIPPPHLPQTTLPQRTLSLSSLILAYNGQIAYPTLLTEMHTPQKDFPKALRCLILTTTTLYILTATLIYHYAGTSVTSPALSSAPPLGRKLAYGFAIPTIVVAGVIPALVASKQIYRHVWRRRPQVMAEKSWRGRGSCAF